MPMPQLGRADGGSGVAFLVAAGIVFEIIAACCSSPQTAEINAHQRAATLMKWVYIGEGLAVIFLAAAASFDRGHRIAITSGGATALILMHALYVHAKLAGLKSNEPATETPPTKPASAWG